jgi:F-type H+-transporting ATPase subunit delta
MMSKKQTQRQARQIFRLCLVNGLLDESRTGRVAQQLAATGYRASPLVLAEFLRLVRLDRDRHTAKIESAAPLSPDVLAEINEDMARRYGPGLTSAVSLRPSLIGGVRIQVGSDVFDGSVQGGLAALESSF